EVDSLWMSPVFFGDDSAQRQLERRFATYLNAEDVVITQSGYSANLGLVQAIARRGTNVYLDKLTHASAWQGAYAGRADVHSFEHNDVESLRERIRESGSGIIVVDSIYSQDGSECPLRDVIEVGSAADCVLVVDESHTLGVVGPQGRGSVASIGAEN